MTPVRRDGSGHGANDRKESSCGSKRVQLALWIVGSLLVVMAMIAATAAGSLASKADAQQVKELETRVRDLETMMARQDERWARIQADMAWVRGELERQRKSSRVP